MPDYQLASTNSKLFLVTQLITITFQYQILLPMEFSLMPPPPA